MALIHTDHRLTVSEYEALVEAARRHGDDRWERTELIDGEIHTLSPEYILHVDTVEQLHELLRVHSGSLRVHSHGSVEIASGSLWEPDVYVIKTKAPARSRFRLAIDLALAIEVSVSTQDRDSGAKLRGYAAAGIPEYWLVTPPWRLTRYTQPKSDGYLRTEDLKFSAETVIGLAVDLPL